MCWFLEGNSTDSVLQLIYGRRDKGLENSLRRGLDKHREQFCGTSAQVFSQYCYKDIEQTGRARL